MQVPIYQRQAQLQPVNPNPDAFGVNVAQARQEMGQQISNIGQLMQKRATERQEQLDTQKVLEADTQMRIEINNMLNSQELDENGKPKGLYNRTLANAAGVTQSAAEQLEQIRKKYSGMFAGENQQNQFNQLYKGVYDSTINSVAKYESTQFQASQDQTDTDNLNQKINDSAADPNSAIDNLASGKAIIEVRGKQKGKSPESIKADYQDYAGKVAQSSIKTLLDAGDYKEAKAQFDKYKGELPGLVSETLKSKIDAVAWGAEQSIISDGLVKKYGEDLAAGDSDIKKKNLTPDKQKELLDTYHSAYNQWQQEKRATISAQIDYYYKNVESAGSGMAAVKYINKLPQKTTDQLQVKTSLLSIAKQLYPELTSNGEGIKTDPAAWYELYDKIQAGKIANKQEMLKEYGSRISFADMKTFWKAMDSMGTVGDSPYNKFSLATDGAALLKKNKINDSDQQAKFWDYVSAVAGDFQLKNKRPPSSEEKDKILQDALTKTIVGKWKFGPLGGNVTERRFNVPPNAQWSQKLNAWVYKDEKGNLVKYKP